MPTDNNMMEQLVNRLAEGPESNGTLWVAYWGRHDKHPDLPKIAGTIIEDLLAPVNNSNSGSHKRSRVVLVHGRYGSGKSSFLEMIREQLDKHEKMICHWIDMPTLTSHIDSTALAAIMAEIVDCLQEHLGQGGNDCMNGMNQRIEDLWSIEAGVPHITSHDLPFPVAAPEENRMAGNFVKGDAWRHLRANKLEKSIDNCLGGEIDKQLVVFLDDLDRCERQVPMDIVRLLLRFGNTHRIHFVLASDWDVLEYGVREWMKSHGMNDDHQPLVTANSALEKYIHWPIKLPGMGKTVLMRDTVEKRAIPKKLFDLFSNRNRVIPSGETRKESHIDELALCDVLVNALLKGYGQEEEKSNGE